MSQDLLLCPGCKHKILYKDFDAHVKSDHQQYTIEDAKPIPQAEGIKKGMNGREQVAEVIRLYPRAGFIIFVAGVLFTMLIFGWRWF
jgi:hypothetical protein